MQDRITRPQFDILAEMERSEGTISQRELAKLTSKSLGAVNKNVSTLNELGYIHRGRITAAGLDALEPFRVKRAVFIAAGFGSRLVPITLNTPKPLVRVNGQRIIDTLLDAVVAAGIPEIVVVRGYLAEQFDQLLYKYPMIRFIENPAYIETNNISSALCAKDLLSNAYVFEADLLLHNPALVRKYHYCSNFLGIPVERSDDWCFTVRNGVIQRQHVGGENCYQEVGISYWDETDGAKLREHIQSAYQMPGGKERYWDQVPFVAFSGAYRVEIRPCTFDDIIEIDTFRELKRIDPTYDV